MVAASSEQPPVVAAVPHMARRTTAADVLRERFFMALCVAFNRLSAQTRGFVLLALFDCRIHVACCALLHVVTSVASQQATRRRIDSRTFCLCSRAREAASYICFAIRHLPKVCYTPAA
jgi:hypothetical protein